MARSWLFVCLWAVVLVVFVDVCHSEAGELSKEPLACSEEKIKECTKTGQTCKEGKCECELPKRMIEGTCKEPLACSEEKIKECTTTGQTCKEGKCECELPKRMIKGTCKEPLACSEEKIKECTNTGQTCKEGECECELPKKMIEGTCKEPLACSEEKIKECTKTGQTCKEGECECEFPKKMIQGTCKGEKSPATEPTTAPSAPTPDRPKETCEKKREECQNGKKTACKVINGSATCVCPPSMKENENGDCFVARTLTIRFKLKSRKKRAATSNEEPTCDVDKNELIEEIKQTVPNVIEESITCNGSQVTFDAFAENEDEEQEIQDIFTKCTTDSAAEDCNVGKHITMEQDSASITAADLCKYEEYINLANQMGMNCTYVQETRMICNREKATAIGNVTLQGIPFEICKALPCSKTTCGGEEMHCVQGSCVCKPQYKNVEGKCKKICDLTPSVCPAKAECFPGEGDQSFYCVCPPKLTGPLCQRENKPLQAAKLNIVIVGVVLASLLLLCFMVSVSIISRLRKKAQGPSFSKDYEGRPQRELRGYDGPYKASDPASLHRGRDHTSL